MNCPHCGYQPEPEAPECPACGLIFSRWEESRRHAQAAVLLDPAVLAPETKNVFDDESGDSSGLSAQRTVAVPAAVFALAILLNATGGGYFLVPNCTNWATPSLGGCAVA